MSINTAFDGQVLIKIGDAGLYNFTLPPILFNTYVGIIQEIESGCNVDLARADIHDRLREWWENKYPHIALEKFDAALEKAVERRLGY